MSSETAPPPTPRTARQRISGRGSTHGPDPTSGIPMDSDHERSVASSMLLIVGSSVIGVTASLGIGWLTARTLGVEGRGEYSAVVTWVFVIKTIVSIGIADSTSWLQSRRRDRTPEIVTNALVMSLGFGTLGVVLSQLMVGVGFTAQRPEVLSYARLALIAVIPFVLFEALSGLYAGQHRFASMARMEGSIALVTILLFAAAAGSEMLTVGSAITIKIGVAVPFVLVGFWSVRRRAGAARFSAPLAAESLRHGSKLQIAGLAELGNTHLDILILTAFVEPHQIGLYAVAMMSASVFPVIASRVTAVLLPVAASPTAGQDGTSTPMELITRTIRVVTLGAAAGAAVIALCARTMITVVFGSDFNEAYVPLLILLPGTVFLSGYMVAASGLQALGLPGKASWSQLLATGVTLAGLAALLPWLGITGAAITSLLSYAAGFAAALRYLAQKGYEPRSLGKVRALPEDFRVLVAARTSRD
jgi:O-antigen/teichoic acid export membrane protein